MGVGVADLPVRFDGAKRILCLGHIENIPSRFHLGLVAARPRAKERVVASSKRTHFVGGQIAVNYISMGEPAP